MHAQVGVLWVWIPFSNTILERGFTLEQPVQNDKTATESDRTVAFVQGTNTYLHRDCGKIPLQRLPWKTDPLL